MIQDTTLHDFFQELICTYKEERYSARDNGAVFRHARQGKRFRSADHQWTFGKFNATAGHLEVASVRVHRIVATAFHGPAPTPEYVVDHLDTNRQNNRPSNLRWVTRLENILLNPITARRIALVCGSVEAFLLDPSKFRDAFSDPNFKWMVAVSDAQARESYQRLLAWSATGHQPAGGSLDRWIFNRSLWQSVQLPPEMPHAAAWPQHAAQRNWKYACEFPCCPSPVTQDPMAAYMQALKEGLVFVRNQIYSAQVSQAGLSADGKTLCVLCVDKTPGVIKPWGLTAVTYENDLFVHASLGSFFQLQGAQQQYSLTLGLSWTGGPSIDQDC